MIFTYTSIILKLLKKLLSQAVEDYKSVWDRKVICRWIGWFAITFSICYSFFIICLWRRPVVIPILSLPFLLLVIFILQSKLYKWCNNLQLKCNISFQSKNTIWEITFFIFVLLFIYILIYGTFESPDTESQWRQVLKCSFDDWHPVMHTYSLYLIYKIVHFHFLVIIVFVALFSHACGWLYVTMRRYGYRKKMCFIVLLIICFSPVTLSLLRTLWKDTAFGITILYLSIYLIHLWHNGGKELKSWQWFVFAFLLVYASFVRHNGFFFTIPILVFLPLACFEKKAKFSIIFFSLIVFCILFTYVITCSYLKSCNIIRQRKKIQTFTESVGLPMCIMSRVMYYHPEQMPKDAHDFMLKICSEKEWKKYYHGNFNSIKNKFLNTSYSAFLTITPKDFLNMFIRTIIASPGCSLNGFIETTLIGVDPFWCDDISQEMYVTDKDGNGFLAKILILKPWGWIFLASGCIVLQMIVLGTYSFLNNGFKVLLMISPFISYTWGTTFLLNGWDHRYFWGILIAGIPINLLLMSSHQKIKY